MVFNVVSVDQPIPAQGVFGEDCWEEIDFFKYHIVINWIHCLQRKVFMRVNSNFKYHINCGRNHQDIVRILGLKGGFKKEAHYLR